MHVVMCVVYILTVFEREQIPNLMVFYFSLRDDLKGNDFFFQSGGVKANREL